MSSDLKVGDVCVIVIAAPAWRGLECTVISGLMPSKGRPGTLVHDVEVPHAPEPSQPGNRWVIEPWRLLKKPPPSDDPGGLSTDFTPAQPEFIEDLQRRLTKVTETV